MRTFHLAQAQWQTIISPGDTVIDATCGNGHDTLFLAKLLQGKGFLISYDIQKQALDNAKSLLEKTLSPEEQATITFKHASHASFTEEQAKLIVYNLGYLPGGDKSITTMTESTIASLQSALEIVSGAISMTCYPGHEEGKKEVHALEQFLKTLPASKWSICQEKWLNRESAPIHYLIIKN